MVACLLALGSNVGDREATLRAALEEIDALPDVRLRKHSQWHRSPAVGGPPDQGEFLNAAALVETTVPPLTLLDDLQDIEQRHGRERGERWAPRSLDLDILLYGREVAETDSLTLPHPRMSFRTFVLQPAAEVAPRMLHPVIGWPVERLLLHLHAAGNQVAIVSTSPAVRGKVAELITSRFAAQAASAPEFARADLLWPPAVTNWLHITSPAQNAASPPAPQAGLRYAGAALPKLTVLIDAPLPSLGGGKSEWSAIVRQPGRGPSLRLQFPDEATLREEVSAAVESVWPDLGPASTNRLE